MLTVSTPMLVFATLTGTFVAALIIANLMGALLFTLSLPFGLGTHTLSAGIIAFPITFLLTDLLNEFYGARGARLVTAVGFGLSIMAYMVFSLGQQVVVAPNTVLSSGAYLEVSGQYTGMFIASLTAYLVGQLLDISVFGVFKRITGSRLIWLRATGSTLISQLVDSFIVGFIAFSGTLSVPVIIGIATANYWVKFVVAIVTTPLLYVGHWALTRVLKREEVTPSS